MWWTESYDVRWTQRLLPGAATAWEVLLDGIDGDIAARDPVGLVQASRSDQEAPLAWLPYLAIERSVDEFSSAWSGSQQRAVIAGSFRFHQVKGTRPALDRALAPLGYVLRTVEWFETSPQGAAYTFQIFITLGADIAWLGADRDQVIRVANNAKNAHTMLENLVLIRELPPGPVYVGGVMSRQRLLNIYQVPLQMTLSAFGYAWIGGALQRIRSIAVHPRT